MAFYALLAFFTMRVIAFGASFGDALFIFAYVAFLMIDKYFKTRSLEEINEERFKKIEQDLTNSEKKLSASIDDIRTTTDTVKLAVGLKRKS